MSARTSRIAAIVGKDMRELVRDRFLLLISILALVVYTVVYYLLPTQVDEFVRIGVHQPQGVTVVPELKLPGLTIQRYDTSEALKQAIAEDGALMGGIDIPADVVARTERGETVTLSVYIDARTPVEARRLIAATVRELTFYALERPLPVTLPDLSKIFLGRDQMGHQLSPQDKFRGLIVLMLLGMEMIALGSLISREVQARTVTAILVTSTTVFDFMVAKATFGTGLAFFQSLAIVTAIGAIFVAPAALLVLLFLGALMFTGFGMLAGARGRDFTEVMFWVMLFFIPALVPAIAMLFPGTASLWIKLFPTYPLATALDAVFSDGAGLLDLGPKLAALLAWDIVIFGLGWAILARKVVRI